MDGRRRSHSQNPRGDGIEGAEPGLPAQHATDGEVAASVDLQLEPAVNGGLDIERVVALQLDCSVADQADGIGQRKIAWRGNRQAAACEDQGAGPQGPGIADRKLPIANEDSLQVRVAALKAQCASARLDQLGGDHAAADRRGIADINDNRTGPDVNRTQIQLHARDSETRQRRLAADSAGDRQRTARGLNRKTEGTCQGAVDVAQHIHPALRGDRRIAGQHDIASQRYIPGSRKPMKVGAQTVFAQSSARGRKTDGKIVTPAALPEQDGNWVKYAGSQRCGVPLRGDRGMRAAIGHHRRGRGDPRQKARRTLARIAKEDVGGIVADRLEGIDPADRRAKIALVPGRIVVADVGPGGGGVDGGKGRGKDRVADHRRRVEVGEVVVEVAIVFGGDQTVGQAVGLLH